MKKLSIWLAMILTGCASIPEGVKPVDGFKVQNYLGRWYEIARLDHSFERGLTRVTADYSLRDDGGLRVVNRGYLAPQKRWKEAVGKAYFVDGKDKGYLKVSFFAPFTAPMSSSTSIVKATSTRWSAALTGPTCGSSPEHPHWMLRLETVLSLRRRLWDLTRPA